MHILLPKDIHSIGSCLFLRFLILLQGVYEGFLAIVVWIDLNIFQQAKVRLLKFRLQLQPQTMLSAHLLHLIQLLEYRLPMKCIREVQEMKQQILPHLNPVQFPFYMEATYILQCFSFCSSSTTFLSICTYTFFYRLMIWNCNRIFSLLSECKMAAPTFWWVHCITKTFKYLIKFWKPHAIWQRTNSA